MGEPFPRAKTPPTSFTNDFARFYGMLRRIQFSGVSGFGYYQVLPAPEAEMLQRFQRAEQVYEQKLWRAQVRDWVPFHVTQHQRLPKW